MEWQCFKELTMYCDSLDSNASLASWGLLTSHKGEHVIYVYYDYCKLTNRVQHYANKTSNVQYVLQKHENITGEVADVK